MPSLDIKTVRKILFGALVKNIYKLTVEITLPELTNKYGYTEDNAIWRELIIDLDLGYGLGLGFDNAADDDLYGFAYEHPLFKYLPRIFMLDGKYYMERLYRRRKTKPSELDAALITSIVDELLQSNIAIMLDTANIYDDGTGSGLRFRRYTVLAPGADEYYRDYCRTYFDLINSSGSE